MNKKEEGFLGRFISSLKKNGKGQVTVFIIVGILALLLFGLIFMLSFSTTKEKIAQETQKVQDTTFDSNTVNLLIEDCVEDSISKGLVLLGKQGRLWADQAPGAATFTPQDGLALKGELAEEGGRVLFGIKNTLKLDFSNAYPCKSVADPPFFCKYTFPNGDVAFGSKVLITVGQTQADLNSFIEKEVDLCLKKSLKETTNLEAINITNMDLKLSEDTILLDGELDLLRAASSSPQTYDFSIVYQTEYVRLLEQTILSPLKWDVLFADFEISNEVISSGKFEYAKSLLVDDQFCLFNEERGHAICTRSYPVWFSEITLNKNQNINEKGDDLLTFLVPMGRIVSSVPEGFLQNNAFLMRVVRQNRPPALNYISKCSSEAGNYLVQEGKLLEFTAIAHDPDEETDLTYYFLQEGQELIVNSDGVFSSDIEGFTLNEPLRVRVSDGFLEDWQDVVFYQGDGSEVCDE